MTPRHRRVRLPLSELWAVIKGEGLADMSVSGLTAEERHRHAQQAAIMEGAFKVLPQKAQDEARWRQAVMIHSTILFRDRNMERKTDAVDLAAIKAGVSPTIARRWLRLVDWQPYGRGYWHLLLMPRKERKATRPAAADLWVIDRLEAGMRPSEIASRSLAETGIKIGIRSIHRLRNRQRQTASPNLRQFKNRFK